MLIMKKIIVIDHMLCDSFTKIQQLLTLCFRTTFDLQPRRDPPYYFLVHF
jgi:hypothetical protein